jgi:RNA polymerase sporulation-specific sigma factor
MAPPGGVSPAKPVGPLPEETFFALLARARAGDGEARRVLVEANLRLVWSVVGRFSKLSEDPEDLFQIGCLGLLKAVDAYDPAFGSKFSTYAVPMVLGEIRRYLRDHGPVHVARSLKQLSWKVRREQDKLRQELGREPDIGEVAAALRISREEASVALESAIPPVSIDEPLYPGDDESLSLADTLTSGGIEERMVEGVALRQAVAGLPDRERQVLTLRFFADKTQSEIARELGVSQVQVCRLEKRALKRIRATLVDMPPSAGA